MPELVSMPTKRDRQRVDECLDEVVDAAFDEVVILGFKNGKSYLLHSKIADTMKLVGALESIKHRMLE